MSLSYDTCVYCIVLVDAGPEVPAHPQLRKLVPGGEHASYHCDVCTTAWSYGPEIGWKRDSPAARA